MKDEVSLLIDLYQRHSCLYAVKSSAYKNKHARNSALNEIEIEMQKIKASVTIAEIKSKFNNLRTNFLSEYKKYKGSIKSGMGVDELYRPSLWYFEKMMFISEHTVPRSSTDSITENFEFIAERGDECIGEENQQTQMLQHECDELLGQTENDGEESIILEVVKNSDTSETRATKNKKKRKIDDDDVLTTASETMRHLANALNSQQCVTSNNDKNGIETFAEFIASKLKVMADNTAILEKTEEDITNIIFQNLKIYRDKTN